MKTKPFAIAATATFLAGCTTYVEQPREPYVYQQPPPQRSEPYVNQEPPPPQREPYYDQQPSRDTYAPSQYDYDSSADIRSEDDFYEPLRPYGRWEVVGSYGRCWVPARVERDWRPYCNG